MFLNQKGLTLVEILASIALFAIITTVFLALFNNYMNMTNRVEDDANGLNIAEKAAYYIKSSSGTKDRVLPLFSCSATGSPKQLRDLSYLVTGSSPFEIDDTNKVYITSSENHRFYPVVKQMCSNDEETDLRLVPLQIEIHKRRTDGSQAVVAHTYRYINLKETGS